MPGAQLIEFQMRVEATKSADWTRLKRDDPRITVMVPTKLLTMAQRKPGSTIRMRLG